MWRSRCCSRPTRSSRFLGTHPAALAAVLDAEADVAALSVSGDEAERALALHAGRAGALRLRALAISEPAPTDGLLVVADGRRA